MADSTPARETQAPSAEQQNQGASPTTPATQQAPPAAATPPLPPAGAASSGKRPRGRPRGSKNKVKPPVYITQENPTTQHIQLVIPPGYDLVATLENFARQHQTGIHVESGYGSVTNITSQKSETPTPGVVDLVSLAGTYLDPYSFSGTIEGAFPTYMPGIYVPWMKMILSGTTWHITRALAVASALTASHVLVNIITFRHLEVQRVEPTMFSFQEPVFPPVPFMTALNFGGGGQASGSGLGGAARMGGEMPAPGFRPPGGEQRNHMPPPGVGFRPPNYRNDRR